MAGISIWTSGRTSTAADRVPDANPKLAGGNGLANWSFKPEGISLTIQVNRGKGKSDIIVWFQPETFADIAGKMIDASPREAQLAFLDAMRKMVTDAQGS